MEQKGILKGDMLTNSLIFGSIIIAVGILGVAVWYGKTPASQDAGGNGGLETGKAAYIGNENAPHTIIEFLDFQCVACGAFFSRMEPEVRKQYIDTGVAKMVIKTLTFIDSFDKSKKSQESQLAAYAAQCAADQGKFKEMHDAILSAETAESAAGKNNENSGNLTREFFTEAARTMNLSVDTFNNCIDTEKPREAIEGFKNDAVAAMGDQISTPTIFIDGVRMKNPFDIEEYKKALSQ